MNKTDYETVILLADFYEISLDELFDRKQKWTKKLRKRRKNMRYFVEQK